MLELLLEEKNIELSFIEKLAVRMLLTGATPQHIGVVMDGNRRWAKERSLTPVDGHKQGVSALDLFCSWMQQLKIPEITFYAFSTDNFKRPEDEVNSLMNLLCDLIQRMINKIDILNARGIRIDIYGNLDLLPKKMRSLSATIMLLTMHNSRSTINLAIAYKSSEEIDRAANLIKEGVDNGELLASDIDEQLLSNCLYTGKSNPPDFFIRTSGEYRFSDFFLWQFSYKLLYITHKKWPDMSSIDIFKALSYYQRNISMAKKREINITSEHNTESKEKENDAKLYRIKNFLKNNVRRRNDYLQSLMENNSNQLE